MTQITSTIWNYGKESSQKLETTEEEIKYVIPNHNKYLLEIANTRGTRHIYNGHWDNITRKYLFTSAAIFWEKKW